MYKTKAYHLLLEPCELCVIFMICMLFDIVYIKSKLLSITHILNNDVNSNKFYIDDTVILCDIPFNMVTSLESVICGNCSVLSEDADV